MKRKRLPEKGVVGKRLNKGEDDELDDEGEDGTVYIQETDNNTRQSWGPEDR